MPFGSKRPTFKPTPYGYSRRSRGIPRWLLLLITGVVLGAGGVLFLQRSYGPQRLTVEQSEQLRMDLNKANLENQRLVMESKKLGDELNQAKKTATEQQQQVAQTRRKYENMASGIDALIDAIPADPRGTSPGIRAADMVERQGNLNYKVLLIQDVPEGEDDAPTLKGEIKLVASGTYTNGKRAYIDVGAEALDMGRFVVIQGDTELPKGYRARQVTIQITAEGSDKVIATRTIRVANKR